MAPTLAITQPVYIDGEHGTVLELPTRFHPATGEKLELAKLDTPTKTHLCARSELVWDDQLGAFYLPGRLLSARQKHVAVRLMDAGALPSRPGRPTGGAPHPDDHLAILTDPAFVAADQEG